MPKSRKRPRPKAAGNTPVDTWFHRTRGMIAAHGWAIAGTTEDGRCEVPGCRCDGKGDDPNDPRLYTVGLTSKGLPELLIEHIPVALAAPILNGLARQAVEAGRPLEVGVTYRLPDMYGSVFTVSEPTTAATRWGAVRRLYPGRPVVYQQITRTVVGAGIM